VASSLAAPPACLHLTQPRRPPPPWLSRPKAAHPQPTSCLTMLCSWGALDLHPATVNAHYPGDVHQRTQLHIAVRRADPRAIEQLLANGADVAARDEFGNTPLHYW